jgi:hypothetical protein
MKWPCCTRSIVPVLTVFCATLFCRGGIAVYRAGTGVLSFDSAPTVSDWRTGSVPGGSQTLTTAAAVDAAVQSLAASAVSNALTATLTIPPSQNAYARWNAADHLIQTRPAGNACTTLMAVLTNASGSDISNLVISYSMGASFANVLYPEQVPGYRVYYSTSGDAASWQLIPSLSTSQPGPISGAISLVAWNPGAPLFLLWADDDSPEFEVGYSIDNFCAAPIWPAGAIAVGPFGTATNHFDSFQTPDDGWTTAGMAGVPLDITNAAQLDAAVQTRSANDIQGTLWKEYTAPPDNDGGNNTASQNLQTFTLQSRAAGNAGNLLMATLRNDTGATLSALRIGYGFGVASSNVSETVYGFRVFYSVTGSPGSWQVIPELCHTNTAVVDFVLEVGRWVPGSLLYLAWADDNGPAATSGTGAREGVYTIDDFWVSPAIVPPRLMVLRADRASSYMEIGWSDTVTGYGLEFASRLDPSDWKPLDGTIDTYGGFHRHWTVNPTNAFYRLTRP